MKRIMLGLVAVALLGFTANTAMAQGHHGHGHHRGNGHHSAHRYHHGYGYRHHGYGRYLPPPRPPVVVIPHPPVYPYYGPGYGCAPYSSIHYSGRNFGFSIGF